MSAAETVADLASVSEPGRAATLLQPLRLRILEEAEEPRSAATIADRIGLPRQKVNYHVRALADAGFLRKAGQRKKRNMVEQRWVATARRYVLSPQLLGVLGADRGPFEDAFSAGSLIALMARAQGDVATMMEQAAAEGARLATLSLHTDFRFVTPEQRAAFTQALQAAIAEVIAEHSAPMTAADGSPHDGRPFRLVLGCFPTPRDAASPPNSMETAS